jgi:hypothetical protein
MPGVVPTGIPTGVGSLFATQVIQAIAAQGRFVLPAGTFYVYVVGVDVRLQIIDSAGGWNNITAAGVIPGGVLVSDGASLAMFNGHAVNPENITYIRVLP